MEKIFSQNVKMEEELDDVAYYEENYQSTRPMAKLIFLVAFTAIMLITSTYAWLSVQEEVTLSGIKGTIKSVEGIKLSLDAKNWTQELNLAEVANHLDLGRTLTEPYLLGENIIPDELLPLSTTGIEDINKSTEVTFYKGTNDGASKLTEINQTGEGYYAIDLFLQNSSEEGVTTETLQLDIGSSLMISGDVETGLQNTSRLGIAMYTPATLDIKAGQTEILGAYNGATISDLAIWEPNANAHSKWVVEKNNELTLRNEEAGVLDENGKFGTDTILPTYALTSISKTKGTIENIYNWDIIDELPTGAIDGIDDNTGLIKQITLQTEDGGDKKIDVSDVKNLKSIDGSAFEIPANTVVKLRIYLWLEGQDVDTINQASYGGNITIDLGLTKSKETTLTQLTNDDIGQYIDLGTNYVGTGTTKDWTILYVDKYGELSESEGESKVYAILSGYLPNSTGYAEAAGLNPSGTYIVNSQVGIDDLATKLTSNWTALKEDINISDAIVTGAPTGELIQKSYNYKKEPDMEYTTGFILKGNVWAPQGVPGPAGYWIASIKGTGTSRQLWMVHSNGTLYGGGYTDPNRGVRPVVCIPYDTTAKVVNGTWTVIKP